MTGLGGGLCPPCRGLGSCPCSLRLGLPSPALSSALVASTGVTFYCHPADFYFPFFLSFFFTSDNNINMKEKKESEVSQSCLTLCGPMDCSPPGSSVHGILQARILEWVAMPSPRDLPDPGIEHVSPALQADTLPSEPPGKPNIILI